MKAYLSLIEQILNEGSLTPQRAKVNGAPVNMLLLPGLTFRHDLRRGFPLLTTKKVPMKLVAAEDEFFIKGEHRKEDLHRRSCPIWNEWHVGEDENELGRIYGVQWREWKTYERESPGGMDMTFQEGEIDQLKNLLDTLASDPYDRRQVVTAWNPAELDQMALPACHMIWQTVVTKDTAGNHVLNLCMTMRSADMMLGVPFNIASYALLLTLIAKHAGMIPGVLSITMNNAHIYENHIEAARLQLTRAPRILPEVKIPDRADGKPFNMLEWEYDQIEIIGYSHEAAIKMDVAV